MNLGENIYRFRTQRNMSQGALADALEVSRQSVSKWENNSATPELDKLIKMSEIFGVSLDALVGRETSAPPPPTAAAASVSRERTPIHRIIGIILLCFGLAVTLLLSISRGFIPGVVTGLPFTIVGCILLASTEGYVLKCAWALSAIYAPLLYYFMLNHVGIGYLIRRSIFLVWFSALCIVSYWLYRKGELSDDSRKLVVGSMILTVALFILLGYINQAIYNYRALYATSGTVVIPSP